MESDSTLTARSVAVDDSTAPSAELRIMALAERLMAVALAISFVAVIAVGRAIDPFVLGACTALACALVRFGPRLRSDTRLHLLLSMVFVIDVSLTFVYIDGYGVDIVWLFVLPVGAGLLGRWQHIAVWSTAVAVAFLVLYGASGPDHMVWHNPTTLPNLVGTSGVLFLTGYGMLWSRRQREAALRSALIEARHLAEQHARAERCARANEQARRRFLATMSHELRTPMAGVLLAAESIDLEALSDEHANTIRAIRNSADSLVGLLNEVLDLARLERSQNPPRREPFEVTALVEGVAAVIAPTAASKGLSVVVEMPPELTAEWEGDEARLRRVLSSLANHSLEQTAFGTIRLRAERTDNGIRFSVDDTGGGLDPLVAAAVFDPTTQSERIDDALGTSLHLTIARDLVAAMGGRLVAHTEPLVGSTFTFELDLVAVDPATIASLVIPPQVRDVEVALVSDSGWAIGSARNWLQHWGAIVVGSAAVTLDLDRVIDGAAPAQRVESLAAAARHLLPNANAASIEHRRARGRAGVEPSPSRRCLVVDDDRIARTLIATALSIHGHSTIAAENGAEALSILETEPVDIMFVDLTMPIMDGIETIRRVRSGTTGRAALPICVVSGTSSQHDEILALGADRFLLKPPRVSDLAAVVDELTPPAPPNGSERPQPDHTGDH